MEIKVIKASSLEEAMKAVKAIVEEEENDENECCEEKKDFARGMDVAEARYDKFIDLVLDLVDCVLESGEFTRDCALFRKHMHEAPIHVKRSFFKCFSSMSKEMISDIMELVGEHAWLFSHCKEKSSNVKGKDMKDKESNQTKKEKKNSNLEKK